MERQVSVRTRKEVLAVLSVRYQKAERSEKVRILDELVTITGYHRKHVIRLLGNHKDLVQSEVKQVRNRIYDEVVKETLVVIWEIADRICSKRFKAIIPCLIESMERHGYLQLDPVIRDKLMTVSVATIDRLLKSVRAIGKGSRKRRRRPNATLKKQVPVRTFADWNNEPPGFFEADFVAHNGGVIAGACVHSFVATDVASGWTECLPLIARQETLVVETIKVLRSQLPFPLLGLDFDNDATLMNESVFDYCKNHGIKITRSREYRKNDQAWIEQKNGAVVRRLVGYARFSGIVAAHTLGRFYQLSRLYVNFFQPSQKLRSKIREGAKVTKFYFKPATPYQRLLESERVSKTVKDKLRNQWRILDPVKLLYEIRQLQTTLCALAKLPGSEYGQIPVSQSLEKFLATLPNLWRYGDARPTHRNKPASPRAWRTRTDPFKKVWPEVLGWLQDAPDTTAKELFEELQHAHPDYFRPGQLRTLQRRVREWRHAMARELIYTGLEKPENTLKTKLPEVSFSGNISK